MTSFSSILHLLCKSVLKYHKKSFQQLTQLAERIKIAVRVEEKIGISVMDEFTSISESYVHLKRQMFEAKKRNVSLMVVIRNPIHKVPWTEEEFSLYLDYEETLMQTIEIILNKRLLSKPEFKPSNESLSIRVQG